MSPLDYLKCYRNLKVHLVNGTTLFGIDVHEYRNADDLFNPLNNDNDPTNDVSKLDSDWDVDAAWNTARAALLARISKHGKKLTKTSYRLRFPLPTKESPTPAVIAEEIVDTTHLVDVFTGKGTPEQIAKALRLAEALGLISPTVAAMQTYCDNYIGLDCNGFVGNYLRKMGSTRYGPQTEAYPHAFLPDERQRLSNLEDIKAGSVMVWTNAGHIAIVDRVSGIQFGATSPKRFLPAAVCESTAARSVPGDVHSDGLNYTVYEIYPAGADKVFKVKRGLGPNILASVYIGNLL